jgi:hypothetical protein
MTRNFFKQTQFIKTNALAIALLAAAVGMSALTFATNFGDEKWTEVVIKFTDAPAATQAALSQLTDASTVTKVIQETDEGISVYEIEFTRAGVKSSADISAAGDVMEVETTVAMTRLPATAMAALKKEFPNATMGDCSLVQKTYYEMDMIIDGKKREVKFDAAGNIEDESDNYNADQNDGENEKDGGEKSGKMKENKKDKD